MDNMLSSHYSHSTSPSIDHWILFPSFDTSGFRSWIYSFARSSIITTLQHSIRIGAIRITEGEQTTLIGTRDKSDTSIGLAVRDERFWLRVLTSGGLGFSEAYMMGEIEVDDLTAILELFIDNLSGVTAVSSIFSRMTALATSVSNAYIGQSRLNARMNAIASYDQSNTLFQAFLSKEMMYSCALWSEEESGVAGDLVAGPTAADLECAQRRKLHHILRQARVQPGHRILEFGSGWGGLAIEAAQSFGCEVDTLTLSKEQKALAEERIRVAGLQDRIRVHLLDYRDIPAEFENAFDAFVSIEMLEHVGPKYYPTYFKLVDFALKPRSATAVVTSSTFPEGRYSDYQAVDFMRKYMWPGACLPSATVLANAALTAAQGRFTLNRVENHAAHYPRTLRTWGRRLKANLRQDVIAMEYPALKDDVQFAIFMRKWEYQFAYAEAGFLKGYLACHMLTLIRTDDVAPTA